MECSLTPEEQPVVIKRFFASLNGEGCPGLLVKPGLSKQMGSADIPEFFEIFTDSQVLDLTVSFLRSMLSTTIGGQESRQDYYLTT